ncbi:hypothetical protein GE21DRAFT_1017096 [Neurospora crassa]|nr:hypothetical protein GE21DRAFT_1017096 [Neurospora crassa]
MLKEDGSRARRNVAVITINIAITDLPVISVVTHGLCYPLFILPSVKPDILRLTSSNEAVTPWLLPTYPTEVCLLLPRRLESGMSPTLYCQLYLVKDLSAGTSTGHATQPTK